MKTNWKGQGSYDEIRKTREASVKLSLYKIIVNENARLCEGHPGYFVTPKGDVYSTIGRRFTKMKPGTKPGGYKFCCVGDRKYRMIHRLVATAFIPNPERLPQVNHKDWDKSNNSVENLEWVSQKQNNDHSLSNPLRKRGYGSRLGLTDNQLLDLTTGSGSYKEIGRRNGVSAQTVCNLRKVLRSP